MSVSLYEFADKLNEIMPVIMKEFARRHANELYKEKITLPQLLILNFLNEEHESRMTDLANFMRVSTADMTGIIDRLIRYGYVLRGYEPKDRRIIKIRLSSKGRELIKRINQKRRQMVINIFGKLSESQRKAYLEILMRIKDILTKEKKV